MARAQEWGTGADGPGYVLPPFGLEMESRSFDSARSDWERRHLAGMADRVSLLQGGRCPPLCRLVAGAPSRIESNRKI